MVLVVVLAGMIGLQSDTSTQQVELLRLSYKANKDSFHYGTFRFEFTRGTAASFSDAEADVFATAFEQHGYYAFDGDNARYELLSEPAVLAAATKRVDEHRSSASIVVFRALTDGKVTLRDNIQLNAADTELRHAAIVFPGTRMFYKPDSFEFPLYLGDKGGIDYDLFQDLTAVKDGKLTLAELDMNSRLEGRKVCKFSYAWKDGKRTYWIDVERGSVPLRILDHYEPNGMDFVYIFSDLEHVKGAGWLPRRRLHIIGKGAIVDRIVVKEIDAAHKPPPSAFELDFPEAITCFDDVKKLVYPKRKKWSLLHLPGASAAGVKPVVSLTPPPEMPGEVAAIPLWTIILSAGAVLLLVVGSALMLGRRMRKTREV